MARASGFDRRQLSLFGEPEPAVAQDEAGVAGRAAGPPSAVEPHVDQLAAAAALPRELRMGTSSWSFPGWDGIVYDGKASKTDLSRRGLEAYAQHPLLRAVGIDRTYYGPIPARAFAEYREQVPDDFRFLIKAASQCTATFLRSGARTTDNPGWLDAAFATGEVIEPMVAGLGEQAGVLLFQFPPQGAPITRNPGRFAEKLHGFLEALPPGPHYAVELRDGKLLGSDYFQALAASGAHHGYTVHPRMPALAEQRRMNPRRDEGPLFVRWMLHSGFAYEQAKARYDPFDRLVDEDAETRESLAAMCVEADLRGNPTIVIVNNKAEGSAPRSIFKLAGRIAELRG